MVSENAKKIAKAVIISLLAESDSSDSSESDTTSSSSDDEIEYWLHTKVKEIPGQRILDYAEKTVPGYSHTQFKDHFRMYPSTFEYVLKLIGSELKNNAPRGGRNTIAPDKQLLITLYLVSTPNSYRSISDRFNVPKSTVWESACRVWKALIHHAAEIIKWPDETEKEEIATKFKAIYGFPDVIGCIDACHINIRAPENKTQAQAYINRKRVHSVILQGVCNDRCMFTDVYVGEVGSVHDARVLRRSHFGQSIIQKTLDKHILGDSSYPLRTHLLTPFRDTGNLSRIEKNYNYKHSKTRSVIDRAFALLKSRFRRLEYLDMSRTDKIPCVIMACCILHNICQTMSDKPDEFVERNQSEENDDQVVAENNENDSGCEKRLKIAQDLSMAHSGCEERPKIPQDLSMAQLGCEKRPKIAQNLSMAQLGREKRLKIAQDLSMAHSGCEKRPKIAQNLSMAQLGREKRLKIAQDLSMAHSQV